MKDEQLDQFFRSAIEDMDTMPPQLSNWDKEHSFTKIQEGLYGSSTNKSRGFFDLAAAAVISVLALAYGVSFFTGNQATSSKLQSNLKNTTLALKPLALQMSNNTEVPEQVVLKEQQIPTSGINATKALETFPLKFEQKLFVHELHKPLSSFASTKETTIPSNNNKLMLSFSTPFHKKQEVENTSLASEAAPDVNKSLAIELPIGMSYSAMGVAPVIAAQATLSLPSSKQRQRQVSAAISAYNTIQENESGKTAVRPVLFAESSFGIASRNDGFVSGHAVGAGYQLNNSEVFEGRAVKFNYTISIKKRVRVSAEAMVSDGFRKVQPGFKVTFI